MMDEKEMKYQFMTILTETHPGLTFEEYRDCCIFLLFFQYLCLRYDDRLDEEYKLNMMVRLAIRGKLQMDSFLRFLQNTSAQLHLYCSDFYLTDFSFYKQLLDVQPLEKQKSYARFFRKIIKKIEAWEKEECLYECYPACFEALVQEFASMKKDTAIPANIVELYQAFGGEHLRKDGISVFQPEFRYGTLLRAVVGDSSQPKLFGYEKSDEYIEYMTMLSFMYEIPKEQWFFVDQKQWLGTKHFLGKADRVCIYMPDGVEAGDYLTAEEENKMVKKLFNLRTKGELPLLLSAFPILKEDGDLMAILPSALLYREGKEAQVRKYLVEDMNCLDTIVLLPDSVFPSLGQQEVFLYIKKNRKQKDIMFFDCSTCDSFDSDLIKEIKKARKSRKDVTGFCSCVQQEEIQENDYNLNLPRYIKQVVGFEVVDINEKRKRIAEIEQELKEIDQRIEMYRCDLELDRFVR
ncbi:MAG: N-6 DNA methylase [Eubacteriales bacterium]|nr:N-6 DNA methylase [Eubacteriales bacterium]